MWLRSWSKSSSSAISSAWSTLHLPQQVTRNAFLRQSKGIELVKRHVAAVSYFILDFTKMILNPMNYRVCFGFAWFSALLFTQPFTSNCCTSPLTLENKNKHTGPDKSPLLTQPIDLRLFLISPLTSVPLVELISYKDSTMYFLKLSAQGVIISFNWRLFKTIKHECKNKTVTMKTKLALWESVMDISCFKKVLKN